MINLDVIGRSQREGVEACCKVVVVCSRSVGFEMIFYIKTSKLFIDQCRARCH
jgi:hypothetical protein